MSRSLFNGDYDHGYPPKPEKAKPSLIATPCSQIEEKRAEWVWRGYIPRAALTLLAGPPKAGKSTALMDIVARVSDGREMPDHQPCERPGKVLVLSGEDSPAHVIVPRLRVAGANLDNVRIVTLLDQDGRPRRFVIGPEDTALLERQMVEDGSVLGVVDPLSIYMGNADPHREQDVRQTLWHLSELAERTGVAFLASKHWNKARTGDALAQIGGSVGFTAAARSILTLSRDPGDKSARVLAVGYSNYATDYPSLGFRLESVQGEDVAHVGWTGVSRHDADALAAPVMTGADRGALSEAEDFLTGLLGAGRVPSKEILAGAAAAGIAPGTLRRAKATLSVRVEKDGLAGGWFWRLPTPEDAQHSRIDIFDTDAKKISTFEDAQTPDRGDAWEPEVQP